MVKASAGAKQGVWEVRAQKTQTPNGFQGKILQDGGGVVVGYVISWWTFLWLVGGEVMQLTSPT